MLDKQKNCENTSRVYCIKFCVTLALFTLYKVWFVYSEVLDLVGDEAHYWEWSRRLGINYYSKGPVIAYIIKLFTYFGGDTPFFVRLGSIVISVLFALVVYKFSLELFSSPKVAFYTVLVFEFTPIFFAGGVFMTIDAPFMLCWLCALFLIYRGINTQKRIYWLLFGLCAGVGFLAKYTMFLIYPVLWVYLAANRGKTHRVKDIVLAHAISMLFVIPPLIWNILNDWATFRHVSGQVGGKGFSLIPLHFLGFVGSQLGVVSPLFFVGIIATYVISYRFLKEDDAINFLFWFSVTPLLVFTLRSFFGKVQGNWPAPAYIASIFAMTALYFGRLPTNSFSTYFNRKWALRAFAIPAIIFVVAPFPRAIESLALPFVREGKAPTARISGWRELGEHIDKLLKEEGAGFVFSDSYQVTSEMAFYAKSRPPVFCANLGRRQNQYDYWPGFENYLGQNGIFVKEARPRVVAGLRKAFKQIIPLPTFVIKRNGYVFKKFYLYKCIKLLGFEKVTNQKRDF